MLANFKDMCREFVLSKAVLNKKGDVLAYIERTDLAS